MMYWHRCLLTNFDITTAAWDVDYTYMPHEDDIHDICATCVPHSWHIHGACKTKVTGCGLSRVIGRHPRAIFKKISEPADGKRRGACSNMKVPKGAPCQDDRP